MRFIKKKQGILFSLLRIICKALFRFNAAQEDFLLLSQPEKQNCNQNVTFLRFS